MPLKWLGCNGRHVFLKSIISKTSITRSKQNQILSFFDQIVNFGILKIFFVTKVIYKFWIEIQNALFFDEILETDLGMLTVESKSQYLSMYRTQVSMFNN